MLETGIYVRVSTEEQAQEGYSIRAQEQKLKDYARIKDWSIFKIYRDEGISGKNISARPAINELIEDIKQGNIKNVLVFKIDRLTRNTRDLIDLVEFFNAHDCTFNSLNESIDTQSATGRMFIKIIGIFAEFERENIVERVTLGLERKVKEGYTLATCIVTYGYNRNKGEKIQTINEEEAKVVRQIFDMFLHKNMTYHKIAKILNDRNIPTKLNSVWQPSIISAILKNSTYKGYVRYAVRDEKRNFETKGLHEPIITEELFDETQVLIKKKITKVYKKPPQDERFFAGLLFCGICGRKLTVHRGKKTRRDGTVIERDSYRCNDYSFGRSKCTCSSMTQSAVEKNFVEYIKNVEDFNALDEIQLAIKQEVKNKNLEQITELVRQIERLERREKEILALYVGEQIDFENYIEIKKTIEKDRKETVSLVDSIQENVNDEISIKKENIIKKLKENWEYLTDGEKRQFLINFVDRIDIVNHLEKGKRYGDVKILNIEFSKF